MSIDAGSPHASGALGGLPYAAKDMFRSPAHEPTCGFAAAGDMGIVGTCDLLARLDAAGADFVGFTNMPALAYEPSGWNAARGRVRNPWNPQFISGGSSSGSAAAVASGSVVAALGSDTRRLAAHSGPCLRRECLEADLGSRFDLGRHGAGAHARHRRTHRPQRRRSSHPGGPHGGIAAGRLGFIARLVLNEAVAECEPSVRRAIEDGLAALAGCHVTLAGADGTAAIDTIDRHALVVMQGEAARLHHARLDNLACDQSLRRRVAKGLEIDDRTLDASRQARPTLAADFIAHVLRGADAAVLPVMTIRTPDGR